MEQNLSKFYEFENIIRRYGVILESALDHGEFMDLTCKKDKDQGDY